MSTQLDPTRIEDWAEVERFFRSVVELDKLAGRPMSRRDHRAMRTCARVASEVREGLEELRHGVEG